MKECYLKKIQSLKAFPSQLAISFKKLFRIAGNDSLMSTSNLQVSRKRFCDTFLAYEERQRINAQLMVMERRRAEAIQFIHEHNGFG